MKNQKGQTTTEYILIIAMIVGIAIGAFKLFGPQIQTALTTIGAKIGIEAAK